MGTSFPVRYGILILILFAAGCQKESDFHRPYLIVQDKLIKIEADSTRIGYITTGSAQRLYSGEKSLYKSYALFQYSFPGTTTFDSMKFVFNGDSIEDTVYAISLKEDWNDTTVNYGLKDSLIGDTFWVYAENGETLTLNIPKDTFLLYMANHGFALANKHWQSYYSKESSKPPQLYLYGDSTIVYKPVRDAYIIADTTKTIGNYYDTLLLETGMMTKIFFTLPLDSILNINDSLNKLISASVLLSVRDSFPYSVECVIPGETLRTIATVSGIYPEKTTGINVLDAINDSSSQLFIEPQFPASTPCQTSLRGDSFLLYLIYKSTPKGREGL